MHWFVYWLILFSSVTGSLIQWKINIFLFCLLCWICWKLLAKFLAFLIQTFFFCKTWTSYKKLTSKEYEPRLWLLVTPWSHAAVKQWHYALLQKNDFVQNYKPTMSFKTTKQWCYANSRKLTIINSVMQNVTSALCCSCFCNYRIQLSLLIFANSNAIISIALSKNFLFKEQVANIRETTNVKYIILEWNINLKVYNKFSAV